MKLLFSIIFSLLSLLIFAQKTKPNVPTIKLETYIDSANKFKIKYPTNWTLRKPDATEKAKLFVRSPSDGDNDDFTENLNIIKNKINVEKVAATELQLTIKATFEKNLSNFKLIKEKITISNGVSAYYVEYEATKQIDGKNIVVNMVQQIFVKNFTLNTLTYSATEKSSKNYYNAALEMIKSYTLLN